MGLQAGLEGTLLGWVGVSNISDALSLLLGIRNFPQFFRWLPAAAESRPLARGQGSFLWPPGGLLGADTG